MATLPIEAGTDGAYRFLLVPVPAGRDQVLVEVPDPSAGPLEVLARPAA